MDERLVAGAMSGTSADGVDVAITAIRGQGLDMSARLLRHRHRPYHPELRRRIFAVRASGAVPLAELAGLGTAISLAYAMAINDALADEGLTAGNVAAVAAHGQTLFHHPPETIQWLDAALLAAGVGCRVVSDFRRADCAAGGQGAPLVPFADYLLFRHEHLTRAVVNIGGIANLTLLPAAALPDQVRAFDTGPGNCISDYLMREHDPEGPGYDVDGCLAARGTPNQDVAGMMDRHDFFDREGPRSTDGPAMVRAYVKARRGAGPMDLADELATACWITAEQIVRSVSPDDSPFEGELILSGGGTKNQAIMGYLQQLLPGVPLRRTDEFALPSDAKEALAFALLGAATLDGLPSNIPSATGARRRVVLGSITPKP